MNPQLDFVRTAPNPATAIEPYQFSIRVNMRPAQSSDEDLDFEDQGGSQ
jgi:hypothetical protein